MPSEENKSTEQKAAESEVESFRKDLGPFVVAAETTRMAMVFMDAGELGNPQGGLPFSVMIDASGRVVQRKLGETHYAELAGWAAKV